MRCIINDTVSFVVKAGGRVGKLRGARNESKSSWALPPRSGLGAGLKFEYHLARNTAKAKEEGARPNQQRPSVSP